jgi:ATP-dependent Clp protease ATP-binding subunit ClpA
MFERFTKGARETVTLAQEEAVKELGHDRIGTEHLLLALVQDDGPAGAILREHGLQARELRARLARLGDRDDPLDAAALRTIGIDLDAVRQATEQTFGEGALDAPRRLDASGKRHVPFNKSAKKALELSLRHALRLKHNHIGTGHLLLGVLHDQDTAAVWILKDMRVDVDALRTDVTGMITKAA